MEMLYITLISIAGLAIGAWGVLGGILYRKPFLLYFIGFFLALIGGYIAYGLELGSQNSLLVSLFTHLKLASAFVSYTIAAAGGSLIASGIVLKAQHLAKRDNLRAKQAVNLILENIKIIQSNAQELIENPAHLSVEEQQERLKSLRLRFCRQQLALNQAVERLEQLGDL
ncbi:hypothetical protein [Pseudomonas veronii]|uniref:Uncharacterized protein n=1 Tax=Pseudomonas veronii TaxID=76761 RepID=A0A5M8EU75_PSEVE|nr:hypothetical protein [Pseudomonas veronii]KAA6169009.1 hypothetical protein F3K54_27025 [Pseudomonas veronii]KAA6175374.1 hypothetical protein F3K53_20140 [Pseudomonas veronii]